MIKRGSVELDTFRSDSKSNLIGSKQETVSNPPGSHNLTHKFNSTDKLGQNLPQQELLFFQFNVHRKRRLHLGKKKGNCRPHKHPT